MEKPSLDQIKKGIEVEMEHTNDKKVALKIALDHLKEDPKYYDKLTAAGLEEGPTNAPGIDSGEKDTKDSEVKSTTDLQMSLRDKAKDSSNFKGLDSKEVQVIDAIIKLIFDKSTKGSTGPTLDAINKILQQKTQSIAEEESGSMELKTYGDLKNIINSIKSGDKKKKIISKAGEVALDQILGLIPGAQNAKSLVDLIKTATKRPDTKKTNTPLDKFDIDDNTSAIVDDTIENNFIDAVAKEIENEPDDKPLEQDYSMNAKLANWLKAKHNGHFVAPEKTVTENKNKEGECCPGCLAELIQECWSQPIEEAEYKGRKVPLGKPMKGDTKKFKVYVKNQKGNVVKVEFGQPGVKIKKNNPARRKSFRARHHCDTNPGPRWKARYWSCRKW